MYDIKRFNFFNYFRIIKTILYSKRIVGPLIREMIGDTLKIYSETFFDCGMDSESVRDSISVIIN